MMNAEAADKFTKQKVKIIEYGMLFVVQLTLTPHKIYVKNVGIKFF